MSDIERAAAPSRCLFCRMETSLRFLGVPMCPICRDQAYDFLWASGVQLILVAAGALGGATFLAEEVLLFGALVIVKHRIPPPWGKHPGAH